MPIPRRAGVRAQHRRLPEQWPSRKTCLLTVACATTTPSYHLTNSSPPSDLVPSAPTPLRLADFALSRKDPQVLARAKEVQKQELLRRKDPADPALKYALPGPQTNENRPRLPGDGRASNPSTAPPGNRPPPASCAGRLRQHPEEYAPKRNRFNGSTGACSPSSSPPEEKNLHPCYPVYTPASAP
jgi:aconitate hydratase